MDKRFCKKCGALLGKDEYEECKWCSEDYLAAGSKERIKEDNLIRQKYEIRKVQMIQ